jgi:excisionase family DNA binding protein
MPSKYQTENSEQYREVLTLEEAAAYLRTSEDALRAMAGQDDIPAQEIGGEWRFLKPALNEWLRCGRLLYRELRRFSPPCMFQFPAMEELMLAVEKRLLLRLATTEEGAGKPGSKKAVLQHFGIFRDDDDMEERLAEARAKRETAG